MCPLAGVGFKWAQVKWAKGGPDAFRRVRCPIPHAMNMRAAEAIVSNAPKAMKIFPISEV